MATWALTGDQYREVDGKMIEIKRRLSEPGGSTLDPQMVARRLQLILDGPSAAPTGSVDPQRAAEIMGGACHGVEALERRLGIKLAANETAQLAAVPFSEQRLLASRDTHLLVACPRASLLALRSKARDAFYYKRAWYGEEAFARRLPTVRWRLIRKEPVPGSTSKCWAAQQATLAADELVPGVCEMAYAVVLHYLETGERLLSAVYARTADTDSSGRRVGVGRFGPDGLRIRSFGDYADYYIGLAAARNSSWHRDSYATSANGHTRPRARA
jgi:hypothetical protein